MKVKKCTYNQFVGCIVEFGAKRQDPPLKVVILLRVCVSWSEGSRNGNWVWWWRVGRHRHGARREAIEWRIWGECRRFWRGVVGDIEARFLVL